MNIEQAIPNVTHAMMRVVSTITNAYRAVPDVVDRMKIDERTIVNVGCTILNVG